MNQKFEQLARTVTDYPQFKDQFSMFCKTIAGGLNNNDKLPGVSFSLIREGATAEIRMLDQIFVIRFYLARTPKERRVGVLGVYLPSTGGDETLLWHTYFDIYGNVKKEPDDNSSLYGLMDFDFLKTLLGESSDRYFLHLAKIFKFGASPLQ